MAFGLFASLEDPTFAFRIVPESQLRGLAEAYARGFDAGRQGGEGALMAGFYVNNNVGIALRCFATGIFGGIGSAFYLVQNGLAIGSILGYVASQGAGGNIAVFVVGHSSLELGAIVISGGAGLTLGWSIVAPGDKTRLASLQERARDVVVIVCGARKIETELARRRARTSAPSSLNFGVQALEFSARVVDLELPIDPALLGVGLVGPDANLGLKHGQFTNASATQALAR